MPQITSYSSLKTTVANWLNRSDLTSAVENFIQNAEGSLRRDRRCRKLKTGTLSVAAEDVALPADFLRPESLYFNGPTFFGSIEIVGLDKLGQLRADLALTTTGVPRYAAVIDGPALRFAPPPDDTYSLEIGYWITLPALSDAATTNWLVLDHPDIYLYAALLESAPFLKGDERLAVWEAQLDRRLNALSGASEDTRFGGTLVRRPRRAIG